MKIGNLTIGRVRWLDGTASKPYLPQEILVSHPALRPQVQIILVPNIMERLGYFSNWNKIPQPIVIC